MGQSFSSNSEPVQITYNTPGGQPATEEFDFLVVACDPRGLELDTTPFEDDIKNRLVSHTFSTSLFYAARPNRVQTIPEGLPGNGPPQVNYAVRFNPTALSKMDGGMYGFRDEVQARDADFQPSSTKTTWALTYQLEDKGLFGRDLDKVQKELNIRRDKDLKEAEYIDWDFPKGKADHELTVDYFGHFEQDGLKDKLPWKIVEAQGKNKTLYVASFTAFESILHCFLYQNMLMNRRDVRKRFPSNKNARIAVIGAGPAGILFASQHLVNKGYTNFKIFESSDRYGGKTLSKYQPIPASDGTKTVPCELGTCYLSPAYFPMYELFKKYNSGEVLALDRDSNAFRSIIDPIIAKNEQEKLDGVEYGAWSSYRKGGYKTKAEGDARITRAGVLYVLYHVCAMGMDPEDPMPEKPPSTSGVIRNLLSIVKWLVTNLADVQAIDESFTLSNLFKGVLGGGGLTRNMDEGMTETVGEFGKKVQEFDLDIDLGDIIKLFSINLWKLTFGEFLDAADMADLKPIMVYAYQVQGYGTIDRIPAYYGLIWVTPYTFLNSALQEVAKPAPGSARAKRGTVNILSNGWLNVWKSIVDKDLPSDRFQYNAKITSINRNL